MTYYDPHPAHVLVADSLFESRKKLIRELLAEPDYCERWDLAYKLLGKYTRREVYALASKIELEQRSLNLQEMCEYVAGAVADILCGKRMLLMETDVDELMCVNLSADMLANPASRLPTSDVWGEE
jgi:hypothetical protein